jgi:thiosulfate/3-mercaptopyruvate sulfurtransferase
MTTRKFLLAVLLVPQFFFLTGCYFYSDEISVESCEGCHINYAHLQKVYTPDSEPPPSGCGGTAPYYEPYDRVYINPEGLKAFESSSHYEVGCIGCHNGVDGTSDKAKAHSGDFLSHPSSKAEEKCASCHEKVVSDYKTSIHNGMGQMRKVAIRSGLTGYADFSELPAHQQEGYSKNCATCHGTCGNCHVVRPALGGGGLANGHKFKKTPDMVNTCVACHTSRGGHGFLGVAAGTQPDVHLTKLGYQCTTCHSGSELHGDGQIVEQRYAYDKLPECSDCHKSVANSNNYHAVHYGQFDCYVCHAQDYNNCGSCHVHGEGARVPAYMDYKIAANPLPDLKPGYKFSLVRRTLAAPDNWAMYDVSSYSNFDALPTYNYTTPHNVLRWTNRTKATSGETCGLNCHIREEGGTVVNKDLYLFQSDLLPWELNATSGITVDGKLPPRWPVNN